MPIDKAITFHKYIGVIILFWTIMHIMAHGFNWYTWAHAPLAQLNAVLDDNFTKNPNVYRTAFLTVAGYTGTALRVTTHLIHRRSYCALLYGADVFLRH